MKGIELSEKYYLEYGAPMLQKNFPELVSIIAIGLCGSGSECFGFDDDLSTDHDFEPGFCIFVPDEEVIDDKTFFQLEKAYSALPKEFMGYKRNTTTAVGGKRHGIIRANRFFLEKTGSPDGEINLKDWFFIPEQSLAEATNGKIFRDDLGIFSDTRKKLSYFPEDVRIKKLAGNLLLMGQSGQYNYNRSIKRGDTAAAQLAAFEFVKSTLNAIFLLNKKYTPYYKWSFRALKDCEKLSHLHNDLEHLISSGNDEISAKDKTDSIEKICDEIFKELKAQGLTKYSGAEAEAHAYSVNNIIKNNDIRNLHILYGV